MVRLNVAFSVLCVFKDGVRLKHGVSKCSLLCVFLEFLFLFFKVGVSPNASFSVFNIFKDSVSEYSLLCFLLFLFLTMV